MLMEGRSLDFPRLLPLLGLLSFGGLAVPATASVRNDGQIWTSISAAKDLGPKFRISQEVVARFSDTRNGLYEIESNTLLGYRLNKKVTLWGGYTHNPQYLAGKFTVMEHRAREQITFDNLAKVGRGTLSARLRLEQRWREGADGTAWRFRPYAKFALPLRAGKRTALVLTHESFVNLNTTSFQGVEGEERMRNFVGLSTPLNKKIGLEAGYLNQYRFVPRAQNTQDHVASVALSLAL
jgi:hypothetical protein